MAEKPELLIPKYNLSDLLGVVVADKPTELVIPEYQLSDLLKDCPPSAFEQTDEDREWLDMPLIGEEIIECKN